MFKVTCVAVFKDMGTPAAKMYVNGVMAGMVPATCLANCIWFTRDQATGVMTSTHEQIPMAQLSFPCIMPGGGSGNGFWCPTTDPTTWRVGTSCEEDPNGGSFSIIVDGDIKVAPLAMPANPASFYFPLPDRAIDDLHAGFIKTYLDSL